jgi:hypothetical protein
MPHKETMARFKAKSWLGYGKGNPGYFCTLASYLKARLRRANEGGMALSTTC